MPPQISRAGSRGHLAHFQVVFLPVTGLPWKPVPLRIPTQTDHRFPRIGCVIVISRLADAHFNSTRPPSVNSVQPRPKGTNYNQVRWCDAARARTGEDGRG